MQRSMSIICLVSLIGAILGGAGFLVATWSTYVLILAPEKSLDLVGNALAGGGFAGFICLTSMIGFLGGEKLRQDASITVYQMALLTRILGLVIASAVSYDIWTEIVSGHPGNGMGPVVIIAGLSECASIAQYQLARLTLLRKIAN